MFKATHKSPAISGCILIPLYEYHMSQIPYCMAPAYSTSKIDIVYTYQAVYSWSESPHVHILSGTNPLSQDIQSSGKPDINNPPINLSCENAFRGLVFVCTIKMFHRSLRCCISDLRPVF